MEDIKNRRQKKKTELIQHQYSLAPAHTDIKHKVIASKIGYLAPAQIVAFGLLKVLLSVSLGPLVRSV